MNLVGICMPVLPDVPVDVFPVASPYAVVGGYSAAKPRSGKMPRHPRRWHAEAAVHWQGFLPSHPSSRAGAGVGGLTSLAHNCIPLATDASTVTPINDPSRISLTFMKGSFGRCLGVGGSIRR
jgi:hypothetical protein